MRLGFNKEHLLVVKVTGREQRESAPVLKQRLTQLPGVVGMATTDGVPGVKAPRIMAVRSDEMSPEDNLIVSVLTSDDQFLGVMEIDVVAGRNFPLDWSMDSTMVLLLNETAARKLGWEAPPDAIGMPVEWIEYGGLQGRVLGVMEDFHLQSIREEIEPIVLMHNPKLLHRHCDPNQTRGRTGFHHTDPGSVAGSRTPIILWHTRFSTRISTASTRRTPTGYGIRGLRLSRDLRGVPGLLGLASFSIQLRTREIGIRKVLGATVSGHRAAALEGFHEVRSAGQYDRLATGIPCHGAMAAELCLCGGNQLRLVCCGWSRRAGHRLAYDRGARTGRRGQKPGNALRQG